jgi:hypothetical protein
VLRVACPVVGEGHSGGLGRERIVQDRRCTKRGMAYKVRRRNGSATAVARLASSSRRVASTTSEAFMEHVHGGLLRDCWQPSAE